MLYRRSLQAARIEAEIFVPVLGDSHVLFDTHTAPAITSHTVPRRTQRGMNRGSTIDPKNVDSGPWIHPAGHVNRRRTVTVHAAIAASVGKNHRNSEATFPLIPLLSLHVVVDIPVGLAAREEVEPRLVVLKD